VRRRFGNTTRFLGLTALGLVTVGCQQAQRKAPAGPLRAVWVTRYDYKTPTDVARIMDNCAQAGFNAVIFQVRGNGTVFYPSDIEPWAEQYDYQDPGYDPLAHAIDQARARDMELHAWVNVMPAWRGPAEPTNPDQLYHTHPEWFWYDANGNRQPLNHVVGERRRGWYASVNPCLPEVRAYLVDVFREIVSRYDVDGLHLDYIRFPNEPVVRGEQIPDYPHDARTLARFHRVAGATPEAHPAAWNRWRTAQVTQLVAEIQGMVRDVRPEAVLSAAVKTDPRGGLPHFQDAPSWARDGLVDALYLMNYTPGVEEFAARNAQWTLLPKAKGVTIVPGLTIGDDPTRTPEASAESARRQIQSAARAHGHFCLFAYSLLFDAAQPPPVRTATQRDPVRAARRQVIIPYIHWLAELARTQPR
jgi:uncharacterized lipoprotein YddW (UPF0748 family)